LIIGYFINLVPPSSVQIDDQRFIDQSRQTESLIGRTRTTHLDAV